MSKKVFKLSWEIFSLVENIRSAVDQIALDHENPKVSAKYKKKDEEVLKKIKQELEPIVKKHCGRLYELGRE
jgi:hypothetical protein